MLHGDLPYLLRGPLRLPICRFLLEATGLEVEQIRYLGVAVVLPVNVRYRLPECTYGTTGGKSHWTVRPLCRLIRNRSCRTQLPYGAAQLPRSEALQSRGVTCLRFKGLISTPDC